MAPPVTCVVVHNRPGQRASWAHHGTPAWCIRPSVEHYRTMKCYKPATGSVRYTDTFQFVPATFKFPETTTEDYLRQSVGDILDLLKDSPKTLPFLPMAMPPRIPSLKLHSCSSAVYLNLEFLSLLWLHWFHSPINQFLHFRGCLQCFHLLLIL